MVLSSTGVDSVGVLVLPGHGESGVLGGVYRGNKSETVQDRDSGRTSLRTGVSV